MYEQIGVRNILQHSRLQLPEPNLINDKGV
jgi:hypothetical protein